MTIDNSIFPPSVLFDINPDAEPFRTEIWFQGYTPGGVSNGFFFPVVKCGNEELNLKYPEPMFFEFAMYEYFEGLGHNLIPYWTLANMVTMDWTDSDSWCR